jgi:hypothetical protein
VRLLKRVHGVAGDLLLLQLALLLTVWLWLWQAVDIPLAFCALGIHLTTTAYI